jgi:hypothetical protein
MLKKIGLTAAAVAVASSGLVAATATGAAAGKPTITATGGDVTCDIGGKAVIKPKLNNPWVAADHSSDPNPAVVALPNTDFGDHSTPSVTTFKGKGTCTGTATDGVSTVTVTAIKVTVGITAATNTNSCAGLVDTGDSAVHVDIAWKGSDGKVNPTTLDNVDLGQAVLPGGVGFSLSGGTVAGSFAGGTSSATAFVDPPTVFAILGAAATSAQPVSSSVCESSLLLKDKKGVPTAKLKKPKGLGKIVIGPGYDLASILLGNPTPTGASSTLHIVK